MPASEWPALQSVLGVDLLTRLLNISTASVPGYLSGNRPPDDVALRLHALVLMVGDLAGAYNDVGIRHWFALPHAVLENRAPGEVLTPGWMPDDPEPRQVRDLERSDGIARHVTMIGFRHADRNEFASAAVSKSPLSKLDPRSYAVSTTWPFSLPRKGTGVPWSNRTRIGSRAPVQAGSRLRLA